MPVEALRREHVLSNASFVMAERNRLAERLLAFRVKHNFARRVVAGLIGCSQSNIKCIEAMTSSPSFALTVAVNRLLELTPNTVRRLLREKGIDP